MLEGRYRRKRKGKGKLNRLIENEFVFFQPFNSTRHEKWSTDLTNIQKKIAKSNMVRDNVYQDRTTRVHHQQRSPLLSSLPLSSDNPPQHPHRQIHNPTHPQQPPHLRSRQPPRYPRKLPLIKPRLRLQTLGVVGVVVRLEGLDLVVNPSRRNNRPPPPTRLIIKQPMPVSASDRRRRSGEGEGF